MNMIHFFSGTQDKDITLDEAERSLTGFLSFLKFKLENSREAGRRQICGLESKTLRVVLSGEPADIELLWTLVPGEKRI